MSAYSRRAKGIELTFPPSGLVLHEPRELSDYVQLVHPVFGPLIRVGSRERSYVAISFVNTGIKVMSGPVAENVVRAIEFAEVSHDSAVARHFGWHIANAGFAGVGVLLAGTRQEGAGSVYALGERWALSRTIFLGPGDTFNVRVFGAADAAMNVDTLFAFTDYTPADVPLT